MPAAITQRRLCWSMARLRRVDFGRDLRSGAANAGSSLARKGCDSVRWPAGRTRWESGMRLSSEAASERRRVSSRRSMELRAWAWLARRLAEWSARAFARSSWCSEAARSSKAGSRSIAPMVTAPLRTKSHPGSSRKRGRFWGRFREDFRGNLRGRCRMLDSGSTRWVSADRGSFVQMGVEGDDCRGVTLNSGAEVGVELGARPRIGR